MRQQRQTFTDATGDEVTTLADTAAADATDDFDRFVEAEGPSLRRHLGRLLSRPQDVEDIYQESLLRTWRRWSAVGSDEQWRKNTLYLIATQEAQKHRARHDHWRTDLCAEFDPTALGVTECPSSVLFQRERAAVVVRVVESLPAHQRELIATHFGTSSLADMARALGQSEESLRQQRHRLHKRLRPQLDAVRLPVILPLWRRATREGWRRAGEVPWIAQAAQAAFVGIVTGVMAVIPPHDAVTASAGSRPTTIVSAAPGAETWEKRPFVEPTLIGGPTTPKARSRPSRGTDSMSAPKDRPSVLPGRVCVRSGAHEACAGETPKETAPAVDTIRIRTPMGDVPVSQNYVASCESWPDRVPATVGECQTTGDPKYLVSPPTPPPGG